MGRKLLSILCGKDLSSQPLHNTKQASLPTSDVDGGTTTTAAAAAAKKPQPLTSLATRVHTATTTTTTTTQYPVLVINLTSVPIQEDWSGPDLTTAQTDPYASPFLQSLLRASASVPDNDTATTALIVHLLGGNAASGPDALHSDALYRLMTDRNGSHLMEAAFEVAPDDVLQKMCTTAFKGRLLSLAQHSSANFVVQAALAAVKRPQQLKRMFEDLRPHLATLLRARRGGVVAVLLAAALRTNSLQTDAADALWHSVQTGLDASHGPTPLHRLLTLDTTTKLGAVGGGGGTRLSPLGCASVITVLQYSGDGSGSGSSGSKKWSEALSDLSSNELYSLVKDPGGCRVIEAYLFHGQGQSAKKRRAMLQALDGGWVGAASTGAGCRFIEKCFDVAEATEKMAITSQLAAAGDRIGSTRYGALVLQYCRVDEYRKSRRDGGGSGAGWQRTMEAAEEIKKEYKQIFGDDGGDGETDVGNDSEDKQEEKEEKKKKKKKRGKEIVSGDGDDDDGEKPKKKKESKKKKAKRVD